MRELFHRRRSDTDKGSKLITISSQTKDKEGTTRVRKSFLYNVSGISKTAAAMGPPEIHIRKSFDTVNRIEKFHFHVKGSFYTSNGKMLAKVYFHHSLNVQICWKKAFLPQKVSGSD